MLVSVCPLSVCPSVHAIDYFSQVLWNLPFCFLVVCTYFFSVIFKHFFNNDSQLWMKKNESVSMLHPFAFYRYFLWHYKFCTIYEHFLHKEFLNWNDIKYASNFLYYRCVYLETLNFTLILLFKVPLSEKECKILFFRLKFFTLVFFIAWMSNSSSDIIIQFFTYLLIFTW